MATLGWLFLREYVPPLSHEPITKWVALLRQAVTKFANEKLLTVKPNLAQNCSKRGFPEGTAHQLLAFRGKPQIAVRSIHDVKGESIGAVLLHGKDSQHQKWLKNDPGEWRCLAYVAMTRAERILVLGCENEEIARRWEAKGFVRLSESSD